MGCISFFCKESNKNIQEDEPVYLFLLKDGKVIEEMYGKYDLYGRVDGFKWDTDWNEICELVFTGNKSNGIAAIREVAFKGLIPTQKSVDDPNQGCGRRKKAELKNKPYHKVY